MDFETLTLEHDGPVATLTLNRPETLNAFNQKLRLELLAATQSLNANPEVRVVIVKGSGRGFSAGADLAAGEMVDPISDQIDGEYKPFLEEIFKGEKIYIAQVHGAAAGVGAALAMTCDLMVMEESAYIYMAFQAIGLIPDGGNTWFLLQQMGYRRALEVVLEGTKITSGQCVALGLANKTAPAETLDQVTKDWALKLAGKAPMSAAAAKRLLRTIGRETHGDAVSIEAQEQNPLIRSNDFRRGVKAFFAKETPVFEGN